MRRGRADGVLQIVPPSAHTQVNVQPMPVIDTHKAFSQPFSKPLAHRAPTFGWPGGPMEPRQPLIASPGAWCPLKRRPRASEAG